MHDLLLWLTASVALYALASNLAWAWRAQAQGRRAVLLRPPWTRLARVGFLLGLPALALWRKVPGTLEGMGLTVEAGADLWLAGRLHWAWSLLLVLGLAAGAAGIWGFGRAWHARARGEALGPEAARLGLPRLLFLSEEALLQESHWAFYRAGLLASGLISRDLAVFVSLLVLALEAWASPFLRQASPRLETLERHGQNLALATLSATVYLSTGGFLWSFLSQWLAMLLLSATGLYLDEEASEPLDPPPAMPRQVEPAPPAPRAPRPIEPTVV